MLAIQSASIKREMFVCVESYALPHTCVISTIVTRRMNKANYMALFTEAFL